MGKAIEVGLHAIVVLNTGDDEENDELEIRGTLIAQAGLSPTNIRETRELWHIGDHDIIGIEQGDNHVSLIGNFQTMVLEDYEILVIGGHIEEDDTFSEDDYMSHNFQVITQAEIDTFHPNGKHFPIFFSQSNQQVRVDYTIRKINI
ncbi:hypothetical protein ABIA69_000788 [Lysinibacillus parviboronicapiens]|uniref:Uncharacterized protein n=1 Tax=Lysinibacillus parviboronicapiens TaxID=436516 RepID=A0ABV2PFE6_9BACI|nr:hypothetical protein [Lysinibacillus parviboronicapiens]